MKIKGKGKKEWSERKWKKNVIKRKGKEKKNGIKNKEKKKGTKIKMDFLDFFSFSITMHLLF